MDPKCTKKISTRKIMLVFYYTSTGVATESIGSSPKIRMQVIGAKCDNSSKWWWLSLCSIEGEEKHMDPSQAQINQLNPCPSSVGSIGFCNLQIGEKASELFKVLSLQSHKNPVHSPCYFPLCTTSSACQQMQFSSQLN